MVRYSLTDETYQKFTVTVRGVDVSMVFFYVLSADAWYINLALDTGEILALGERAVSGVDLGVKVGAGGIYIADINGQAKDPDGTGWKDLFLYILNADEIDLVKRFTPTEPTYLIDAQSDPIADAKGLFLVAP